MAKLKAQKKISVVDAIRMRVGRGDRIPQAFIDRHLQREDIDKRDKTAVAEVFNVEKRYVEAGDIYSYMGYTKRAADLYFREAEQTLDYGKGCEFYKKAARLYIKIKMYKRIEECMNGVDRLAKQVKNNAELVASSESGLGAYLCDRLKEIEDRRTNDIREIQNILNASDNPQ
ncbi:MAG: hypothetical protein WC501_05095 [Candidatus Micrarchaeia archaeon]